MTNTERLAQIKKLVATPFRWIALSSDDIDWLIEKADALERAEAELAKYRSAPVVGWMFQHDETGNVFMVDVQQVEWGYERLNPRHQKIAQLIIRPEAP